MGNKLVQEVALDYIAVLLAGFFTQGKNASFKGLLPLTQFEIFLETINNTF